MKFVKTLALTAAITLSGGIGLASAQGTSHPMDKDQVTTMEHGSTSTMQRNPTMAPVAPTTGQGPAEPGTIGSTKNPASGVTGRTPGASASPSSERANPARNMSK